MTAMCRMPLWSFWQMIWRCVMLLLLQSSNSPPRRAHSISPSCWWSQTAAHMFSNLFGLHLPATRHPTIKYALYSAMQSIWNIPDIITLLQLAKFTKILVTASKTRRWLRVPFDYHLIAAIKWFLRPCLVCSCLCMYMDCREHNVRLPTIFLSFMFSQACSCRYTTIV